MSEWSLKNKKAIVTGGTKGIGWAIVKEFLELGAEVLFTGRHSKELASLETEIRKKGRKAYTLAGDVKEAAHREMLAGWVRNHWNGQLHILVNNAGVNIRKPSIEYSPEDYGQVLGVNMIAPFELTRMLFPFLKMGKTGVVIHIASVAGSFDVATGAPYSMSKAAVIQMTKSLAAEWAIEGVRVNCVSPWFTLTPLTEGLLSNEAKLSAIISRTPMRRVARSEEIAAAVAFLAMDQASYITGQNLSVDGGASISKL